MEKTRYPNARASTVDCRRHDAKGKRKKGDIQDFRKGMNIPDSEECVVK